MSFDKCKEIKFIYRLIIFLFNQSEHCVDFLLRNGQLVKSLHIRVDLSNHNPKVAVSPVATCINFTDAVQIIIQSY